MGPTLKKQTNKENNKPKEADGERAWEVSESFCFFLIFFSSISFLSQIHEFLTVRIRRDKHEKCFTRRGLRVSTRNTRFHQEFR